MSPRAVFVCSHTLKNKRSSDLITRRELIKRATVASAAVLAAPMINRVVSGDFVDRSCSLASRLAFCST